MQGVGGAIMFATSLALLASAYRGRQRGTAFGVYGAVTGASSAVGPLVGGALISALSWQWIFLVNIPIGVIAIVITLVKLSESKSPAARRIDVPGLITFSLGLALLVFALIRGNEQGWGSLSTVLELVGAVVLLLAFFVVESRHHDPMLDLSLLRVPTFVGAQVAAFAISAGLFALFLYLVLYIQNVLGYSALQTGVRLIALSGAALVFAPIAGRLTTVVPYRCAHRRRAGGADRRHRADDPRRRHLHVVGALPRAGGGRHRHRLRQRPAGRPGRRGGRPLPLGHGLGGQLHRAPGGDRRGHRGLRGDLHLPRRRRGALGPGRLRACPPRRVSGVEDAVASGAITRVAAGSCPSRPAAASSRRCARRSPPGSPTCSGSPPTTWCWSAAIVCFVIIRQRDLDASGRADATHERRWSAS